MHLSIHCFITFDVHINLLLLYMHIHILCTLICIPVYVYIQLEDIIRGVPAVSRSRTHGQLVSNLYNVYTLIYVQYSIVYARTMCVCV